MQAHDSFEVGWAGEAGAGRIMSRVASRIAVAGVGPETLAPQHQALLRLGLGGSDALLLHLFHEETGLPGSGEEIARVLFQPRDVPGQGGGRLVVVRVQEQWAEVEESGDTLEFFSPIFFFEEAVVVPLEDMAVVVQAVLHDVVDEDEVKGVLTVQQGQCCGLVFSL